MDRLALTTRTDSASELNDIIALTRSNKRRRKKNVNANIEITVPVYRHERRQNVAFRLLPRLLDYKHKNMHWYKSDGSN